MSNHASWSGILFNSLMYEELGNRPSFRIDALMRAYALLPPFFAWAGKMTFSFVEVSLPYLDNSQAAHSSFLRGAVRPAADRASWSSPYRLGRQQSGNRLKFS